MKNRRCLFREKRAISEMASYVLAVVIVIVLAVITYAFLELLIPKSKPSCDEDRLLAIDLDKTACTLIPQDLTASQRQRELALNLTLVNNGKRSVSGAYIRLALPDKKVRTLINQQDIFFGFLPDSPQPDQLAPSHALFKEIVRSDPALLDSIFGPSTSQQPAFYSLTLEIQPLRGKPGTSALCERAITIQNLTCPVAQKPAP